ncbi:phage protein NinX family protein [Enterobacter hormaechei]|uniref:phage protein NinX family protein n=1 Tax=Enterobacter hormaechei TaxID=158836 RepID=UPI001257E4BD|nr:phage protein NinX family protein [Enterobacter hormaechei]VAM33532.1 Protein of uncharacterised function (DUF2591) [Enterobacter hormaechei]
MDYSKLCDVEINHAVASVLPGRYITYPDHVMNSETEEDFDPCNNAADAWPIISANRISIEYDAEHQCDAPVEWVTAYGIDGLKVHLVAHQPCDKALRSAMIVFLKMQESANVPVNPAGPDIR